MKIALVSAFLDDGYEHVLDDKFMENVVSQEDHFYHRIAHVLKMRNHEPIVFYISVEKKMRKFRHKYGHTIIRIPAKKIPVFHESLVYAPKLIKQIENNFDICYLVSGYYVMYKVPDVFDYITYKFNKKISKPLLACFILIGIFVISPSIIEENRVHWVPWWKNVVSYLYDLPASEIFLIKDPGLSDIHRIPYPISGSNFQHTIVIDTEKVLIETRIIENDPPEYVVKACVRHAECKNILLKVEENLIQYGYERKAFDEKAILLKQK